MPYASAFLSGAALMFLTLLPSVQAVIQAGAKTSLHNFPDPGIIWADGKWWAFATSTINTEIHIQVASSTDYNTWSIEKKANGEQYDAMPTLPAWVKTPDFQTWAPDIVVLDDGSYVMYYSAKAQGGRHCISAATSNKVQGPYTPLDQIMICPDDSGGAFDAAGFKDWQIKGDWGLPDGNNFSHIRRLYCSAKFKGVCGNSYNDPLWSEGGYGGKRYIVYKVQNAQDSQPGTRTPLTLHEVDANDGVTLIGSPFTLLDNNGDADKHSIEGPVIYKTPAGKYVLFFSSGNTVEPSYTVSYAVADQLTGPYARQGVLLKTGDFGMNAPGGMDINWNGYRMLFHEMGQPIGQPFEHLRVLHAARVDIDDNTGAVKFLEL